MKVISNPYESPKSQLGEASKRVDPFFTKSYVFYLLSVILFYVVGLYFNYGNQDIQIKLLIFMFLLAVPFPFVVTSVLCLPMVFKNKFRGSFLKLSKFVYVVLGLVVLCIDILGCIHELKENRIIKQQAEQVVAPDG